MENLFYFYLNILQIFHPVDANKISTPNLTNKALLKRTITDDRNESQVDGNKSGEGSSKVIITTKGADGSLKEATFDTGKIFL